MAEFRRAMLDAHHRRDRTQIAKMEPRHALDKMITRLDHFKSLN